MGEEGSSRGKSKSLGSEVKTCLTGLRKNKQVSEAGIAYVQQEKEQEIRPDTWPVVRPPRAVSLLLQGLDEEVCGERPKNKAQYYVFR